MSNPLLDLVTSSLDAKAIGQIARQIGATPEATAKAASAAVPTLIGALNEQATSPQGVMSLLSALDRDHDGSILDDLGSLLGGLASGGGGSKALDGAGILGHLLGSRRKTVEGEIGKASGLDAGTVGRLLEMLAPIVMAALGKSRRAASDGGTGGLIDLLGGAAKESSGGLGGLLGSLLAGGDRGGKSGGDLAQIGASVLGSLLGKK